LLAHPAGRDLGNALLLRGRGGRRLFGWYEHGCRIAYEVALALNYLHSKVLLVLLLLLPAAAIVAAGSAVAAAGGAAGTTWHPRL